MFSSLSTISFTACPRFECFAGSRYRRPLWTRIRHSSCRLRTCSGNRLSVPCRSSIFSAKLQVFVPSTFLTCRNWSLRYSNACWLLVPSAKQTGISRLEQCLLYPLKCSLSRLNGSFFANRSVWSIFFCRKKMVLDYLIEKEYERGGPQRSASKHVAKQLDRMLQPVHSYLKISFLHFSISCTNIVFIIRRHNRSACVALWKIVSY